MGRTVTGAVLLQQSHSGKAELEAEAGVLRVKCEEAEQQVQTLRQRVDNLEFKVECKDQQMQELIENHSKKVQEMETRHTALVEVRHTVPAFPSPGHGDGQRCNRREAGGDSPPPPPPPRAPSLCPATVPPDAKCQLQWHL